MKAGDRKVYVIDGDVVQYADKSGIDVAKSDKSIVVCDAETGKYEYTSPDQLMNVGEPADPSTLSEAYMANERAKEAAANGEGTAEGNAAAESNAAANGDVSSDGGKAEVVEPAYTDGSRVEINGHEYDVKSAGEKTVVLVDEHGKELAWTRSALDAKLESGDAEVLEPKAEAAPDVATEGLKAGDVFEDSDGNALTVKRVDGDKVVAVGADGNEQTYEDGTFEQMVESGVLKRETTDLNAAQTGSPEGDGVPAFGVGSVIELEGHEYKLLRVDKEDDTVYLENVEGETALWSYSGICIAFNEGDARLIDNKNYVLTDNQGNPVNEDGTLKVEEVKSVDELTDEDFSAPTRNVQLPALPQNVDAAIGANGKPVIIKKNIFEKNWNAHRFPFKESRAILNAALYNTDLVGQTQPNNKPLHWVAIKIDDKSPIVVLEVNENKDNIEIVGWYTLDERNLNRIKRQAEKNGGELVMLSPKDKVESLSTPQTDLSSESKGTEQSSSVQVDVQENAPMPMRVVGKGKNAAQEEDWLATTPKRGHDYVFKESGLDAEEANAFVENKVAESEKNLEKVKGKAPKMGTNIAAYKEAKADYEARVAEAQKAVDYWHAVKAERDKVLLEERRARKEKDKALYDDAVAQEEQRKAEMAQKAAEQEALGSNAVAPAIKEKWENAPKVDGGADEITLPNGEVVTGHYVLTESGAASASHQATNGFAETEGYPVDVNGETVNDRDYKRDAEAQQVTRGMAADYDSRALQSPVVVSGDGVVLSGNGRTMAGEIAALNGSDAKYNAYLRGHAGKFGFTTEQVEGFEHPRVVFVPDGEMPYTSETFAKFNQREQKSQSRTEMAVKLGKVVDDALFGRVMDVIGRHESLAEFYADDAATAAVVKELADAGVIPQTEMAQLFDGGRLSESGQAMVEGVLVGKVFQGSPDAVRQITEVKSMRKAVMAALPEVVACHRLGGGYDLSKELAAAVDLVYKARKAGFKLGQHVSQHARQGNLFQLDDGATVADYNNAAVMMLADVMNDGRVTQLKKVLSFYNTQAADSAQGIGDMFAGGVKSKGQIINEVNELLNNGQEYDRRTPSVADGQGVGGEGGEQGDVAGQSHQGGAGSERRLSEAFDGLAAQLKTAEGEERKRVLGEMRDGIARFAEENGYPVPEFLLTRDDFLAAVPEKDRAKYVEWLDDGWHCPAYYEKGKVYYFVEGCDKFDKDVAETLAHEYTHADNSEFPENVNALTYALEDTHEVTRDELVGILETLSNSSHYGDEAERLESEGKNANPMLADEVIAHAVARMVRDGEQVLDGITNNPTLQFIIKRAYKVRENERRHNILAREASERSSKTIEGSEANSGNGQSVAEGESGLGRYGRSARSEAETGEQSGNGRSAVSNDKEVAAPSLEGAKVGVTDGEKSSATGDVVPSGKGNTPLSEKIATASAEVNTEPTEAQKEAGNYKKGHVQVGTFDITIEQPQGSVRKGTDADGKQWESKMNNTYGYIRGAVGVDGDHIDVFLSNDIDGWNGRKVFVVDQYNPDGSFDEHKVMLGFNDADEAKSDYLANYENGWENGRRIDVTAVNLEDFEKWIASSKRKTKPFGEYSSVKNGVVENNAPVNEDTPSEIQTLLRERECTPISQEHRNLTDEGVVADNAGNPITLYHGTLDKSISVSELEAGHKRADGESADFAGSGVYFTPNKDVAEEYGYNGQVFEAHIKLSKPFYMLGNPGFNESEAVQFSNLLKSKGYDGIINYMNAWSVEHNMIDGGQVVVFNNSSILPIEKGQNNHAAYSITPSTYTNKKGESVERNEVLEYEKALDHLEDVEQKWGDKIQNYVFEHYPTQATTSAESTSEKGLQERKAMKADPVLKQMYVEAKKEIDAADEMVTQKYSALPEDLRQQKAVGKSAQPPTREESILRDVVIEHMKGSGLDVLGTEDGQRVLDMVNEDGAKEHRVYHGSGAEFDHFDHSHMGEGEGAQAYGWGTYVTEVRGIGEGYAIRSKNGIAMSREEWSLKRSELESNIYRAKEQLPFLKGEYKAEVEAQISEWEEQLKDYEPHNYLYTVEIPDDNGGNYLDWNGPVPAETIDRITEYLREKYGDEVVNGRWLSNPLLSSKGVDVSARNGAAIYRQLERALGSDKKASQLLSSLGYAGIKYPAEFRSGGRKDDAKNYVIFNENDAEITDHVRFFKTKNGEAYGFTVGGKIYYDPRIANAETPVHEYAHLWASALKANNAEEWKNVVDLMKGTKVWEEVKKTYPELETDDEIADEVLATYSGRRGAERLREEMRKAAAEGDGVMGKAEAVSALQRVKRAIDKFWKAVADFLHIHYTSAEEVADRVMKDLLDGVDPRKFMGDKAQKEKMRYQFMGEKGAGENVRDAEDYTAFASRYGVSEDMVKDYALGIKTGNLQKANFALTEIRRTMRVANRGMKLSEFGKLFRPVQKELAERYGDIEVLRQEYIDAEMRERGVMEAARKRAEEEAAKRKARADELRLLPAEELDRRYFEAVERGDDAAAREMLDEAARRKGYDDTESEYQGVGAWVAPSNPGYESDAARRADVEDNAPDVNVEDIALGYSLVDENYWHEPRKYMQTDATAVESVNAINDAMAAIRRGEKDVKVKVYRAVPSSVKEGKLRNGDWVTPSRAYAKMHGENRLEGDYRIIEDEVPVNELWWDGNDSREWGFDDGKGYKYKNVENSRKLNDLVTRDDNGEIIAPSKRFDENVEDVRFREDNVKNPAEMSEEEKSSRGNQLLSVPAVNVESNQIVKTEEMSARRAAEKWWREHIGEPLFYDTEVGQVEINENSIGSSLAHRYGQAKLDAITSLKDGFKNAVYLGTMPDFVRQEGVQNHYFAYPIMYNGKRNYVFCRAMQDNNKNRLYVHEVFVADSIQNEGNTLQTAASQPHGGIALYKAILSDVLSAAKVGNNFETLQLSASEKAKQQAANDLAQQMHVEGEVEVVTSTDGLTGRQAKAKGWYDVRTGKVTIVLTNNKNAADVRETVFHEVVAHKGLRNLVGEEHFNTFLDNVYNNAEEGIRQTIDEMAEKKYNGDKRKATEEYMAHLAEDGEYVKPENQGFFAKVRDFLTDLLRKVGIKLGFKLTDNDLRYILWRSWKGLAERDGGSVFEKAEDVKMQHELGQTDEARSASGENGIMFREGSDELKDVVEKMKADVERLHEGELDDLRSGARAIGGRLSELNKAMRLQRAYDMSTVASVTELAKTMLKNGLLSEMSDYDVRRLLSVVNNVHGKGDIRPYVQKVVDMMVGNRLRNVSKAFDKLLAMRGKKVDARGVEVQGELDLAGQRMADVVWKGIGMSDDDVADMCADAQDRMMSANGAEAAAAATDYAGWQIVMRLRLLPYYNNLLAEYLASYTNMLQLIDCQYFTQCKVLSILPTHNLHTPHAVTRHRYGRAISRHRGAEKSVAPTDCSTSLWRIIHRIRPNRQQGSGVGCVRCMQGSVRYFEIILHS